MALGEPDAGKPPVRFDEGRSETVIGLCLSIRPLRLLYSIPIPFRCFYAIRYL